MGDSDDEYDRRRRDKFRRERSDFDRSREREDRRRDDWNDREWDRGSRERRSRAEYRDYDRGRRERFTPPRHDINPQQKRMRRDWDDHGGDHYHGGYDLGYGGGGGGGGGGPSYAPPQHWGHPDLHLMQPHHGIPIQARLGNIHDMDLGPPPPIMKSFKEFLVSLDDSVDETDAVKHYNEYKIDYRRQQMQDFFLTHKDEEWFRSKYHPVEMERLAVESRGSLQNRLNVFLFLMENSWLDNVSLDIDRAQAITKVLDAAVIKMEGGTDHDLRILDLPFEEEERERDRERDRERPAPGPGGPESSRREDPRVGEGERKPPSDKDQNNREVKVEEKKPEEPEEEEDKEERVKEEREEKKKPKDAAPRPRPLHKTCSLFMRSIAPTISTTEVVSLCRRYPGFLRICLSDPHPERRFFRRCWATFDRSVNIKEICWNLQNIRLRDCELAPGVNCDLVRRVRNINGITQHKLVLRNDIKMAAKLIQALDERGGLWKGDKRWLPAQNPIMKNITDYLIEEVSAEEEELLGSMSGGDSDEGPKEGNPTETPVERDDKLAKVLDRLLLYLRVVHSIDYYNTCEYPSEDHMPNRCGMVHVRGPIPPNRITHGEVSQWQKMVEEKLAPLFNSKELLSEDEASKMGRKDPEQEVEKFVSANTQELGKDKWLCPLSGKKFKGPEFVRKHILNKHGDKIEEVKKEVTFFNNFLMDAKRPSLPELKLPPLPGPGQGEESPLAFCLTTNNSNVDHLCPLGVPAYPPNQYGGGRGNYDGFRGPVGYPGKHRNNRMARGDPRNVVEYRDLDAPEDLEFF
uniref:Serrate RNA effector molecule homolog n=1 Tax=Gadus morhua TaxID=8049 RepID=A0A8C5CTB5_GADMO